MGVDPRAGRLCARASSPLCSPLPVSVALRVEGLFASITAAARAIRCRRLRGTTCTPTPPASSPCYRLRGRAAADATTQGTPLLPRLLSSASFTESTFHRGRRCRGRAGRRTLRGGTLQGAHQAAEALQAGFDGGAPAPGVHALEAAVNNLLAREHETRCMNVHATCPRTSGGGRKEIYRKTEIQNLVPSQNLVPERKSSIHNQCVCSVN